MTDFLKQFLGITLSISLMFHGLVLPYFQVSDNSDSGDSSTYISNSQIVEFAGDLPLISGIDQLVVVTSKASFLGDWLYGRINAIYTFHFENYVNSIFKTSQHIELVFGIKEIKFPTHFFW
ncbi:hypothetical protein ACFSKL_14485 [Belliella marina]|uniref:Uncharacterized protein n=1 Tax=Belliella marina TaxID=1644146 RepID=A0ABW4VMT3_9BACT